MAKRTTQQLEVVSEGMISRVGKVLADRTAEEQDEDDGRRDPEGPVEVRVAFEDVEEVGAGVEGRPAARNHCSRVHVEVLRVE